MHVPKRIHHKYARAGAELPIFCVAKLPKPGSGRKPLFCDEIHVFITGTMTMVIYGDILAFSPGFDSRVIHGETHANSTGLDTTIILG